MDCTTCASLVCGTKESFNLNSVHDAARLLDSWTGGPWYSYHRGFSRSEGANPIHSNIPKAEVDENYTYLNYKHVSIFDLAHPIIVC